MDEVAREYGGRAGVVSWFEISGSGHSIAAPIAPALLMRMGGRHQTSGMASKGRLVLPSNQLSGQLRNGRYGREIEDMNDLKSQHTIC